MKAKELRIGNIIGATYTDYDDGSKKYDVCKVVTLDSVGAAEYPIWVEGKANIENYDSFYPIEIDEEWLIKLGFKKINLTFHKDEHFAITEIITLADNKKSYGFPSEDLFIRDVEIKYVHQLQNLYFAITGEELQLVE